MIARRRMLLQTERENVASRCNLLPSEFPRIFRNLSPTGAGPIGVGQWAFCANFACMEFSEVRLRGRFPEVSLACMGVRRLCGKSIMGSGERVDPLRTSGRKEYASCPTRTR